MKRWSRYATFAVTMLMVLALSAMQVVPVLADDGAPPPTETPEVVPPPTEDAEPEAAPTESPAPEATPVATEISAEMQAPAPAEAAPSAAEEAAAEPETPAEVLAQVPAGTEVVVLDKNGKALPLASVEAAEVLYTGDPQWCPVGVTPNSPSCSPVYGSLQALVADVGVNFHPATSGVIWIENVTFTSAGNIVFTGSTAGDWTTWSNYNLTFKGGWLGTGTTITSTPSTIQDSLSILDWKGDITLSDIVFSGVTTGTALTVVTTKNITMTNVKVGKAASHNTGAGAVLNNSSGTGNVTLTNSEFSYNEGGTGLHVSSHGMITLSGIIAENNGGSGAYLDNRNTGVAKNVTLTAGTLEFNGNNGWGLVVFSQGAIALKDITANGNAQDGAQLINTDAITAQSVTLTGTNIFSENGGSGLFVQSNGAIKTNNLIANGNGTYEAVYLDNDGAASAQPVILTGTNEFKFNDEGLRVFSKGAVTLNNVTAINNFNGSGVFVSNTASGHLAPQNVTLTGYGIFHNNGSSGLYVVTYGAIAAANVTANNNGGYGVFLNNYGDNGAGGLNPYFSDGYTTLAKTVTLSVSGGNPATETNDNYSGGLYISSLGAITLSPLNALNNGWDCSAAPEPCNPVAGANGAYLNNDHANAVGGITITGWGSFGNNGSRGLVAYTRGVITLTDLWTWSNQNSGAYLDNTSGTGAVTISGNTGHWSNGQDGLAIYTKGAITLAKDVTANNNGGTGVILDNQASGKVLPQNVTLSGASHELNWNGSDGLNILSYGMITINNLRANGNGGFGALIDNCLQTAPGTCGTTTAKTITLNGDNTFESNGSNGLDLTSKGIITVNNLSARDNGGFGAFFDNMMTGTTAAINVKNTPTYYPEFARNGLDGLRLTSNGTITVMDLDAYENGRAGDPSYGNGVYLDNAGLNGIGNIILGTSRANWVNGFASNSLSGLEVYSNGTVMLSNLRANDNHSYGVYVDNSTSALPKTVVLKGTNDFINDWNTGLYILSKGAITLNNISANDSGSGVYLDNRASGTSTPQTITLTGFGDFFNNWNNGLEVYSYGAITLNNVTANDNGQRSYECELSTDCDPDTGNGFGVLLNNAGATAAVKPAVILNGNNDFRHNADYGLQIVSLGAITVSNLHANDNGVWWNCTDTGCGTVLPGFGARLDNSGAGATGGVTITGGAFSAFNSDYGMWVTSKGAITINVIDAWAGNNGGFGWDLDNHTAGTPQAVTLTSPLVDWGFDFSNNGGYGLSIQSLGNITSTGLDSGNNGTFGAMLKNDFDGGTGVVTITAPTSGDNSFSGNLGDGLLVYSNRAITIGKLVANDNGQDCSTDPCTRLHGNGAVLDNTSSPAGLPQNITITGFGDFYNNGSTGLKVLSDGLITLSNINASDNGQYNYYVEETLPIDPTIGWGVFLDNCDYDPDLDTCTGTPMSKGITLTGNNNFNNNYQDGLWATSLGAIKVNNVNAGNNRIDGAYLNNQWAGAVGGITLTTSTALYGNTFNGNGNLGLAIFSHGAIALNNIEASNNFNGGADLNTDGVSLPQTVTLTGWNSFRGNSNGAHTAFGLNISADGNITLNSVTALWNDGDGVYLDSCHYNGTACTTAGNIMLTGTNTFRGNTGDGIYFDAGGTATLTKITADGNGNDGMQGYAKSITLTCGSMTSNGNNGWWLSARGVPNTITLQGVFAYGNGGGNTYLDAGTLVQTRACPLP